MAVTDPAILSEGKTKILQPDPQTPNQLRVTFKDTATAFNGEKKAEIPQKGELNAKISRWLFELLEKHEIPTCYVGPGQAVNELIYKRLTMIPVEVVVRNAAYGSVCKRFKTLEEGQLFRQPLVEYFLKDDAAGDPHMSEAMVAELQLLPPGVTLEHLRRKALQVNEIFLPYFRQANILCADYKLEFGLDADGKLVLGDELSPDGFRLRDIKTRQVLDKDVFRLDLADLTETYQEVWNRLQAVGNDRVTLDTPQTFHATLHVQWQERVLHPESRTILGALQQMGYQNVQHLRAGKCFEITMDAPSLLEAERQVKAMATDLLSNPVIEEIDLVNLSSVEDHPS